MNAIEVGVRAAATWRLTKLVTEDEITRPVREAIDARWPGSQVSYLVNCPACVSVWAGLAVAVMPRALAGALASSAGTLAFKWLGEIAEEGVSR